VKAQVVGTEKRLHLCIDPDRHHHLTDAVLDNHATSWIQPSCCSVAPVVLVVGEAGKFRQWQYVATHG
jgi:hypothetical protein